MYNGETLPNCAGASATNDCSDATLEEWLHVITSFGYATAYPAVFGISATNASTLTAAMDVARGGKFTTIPTKYPSTAWYTYYDQSCIYECQVCRLCCCLVRLYLI